MTYHCLRFPQSLSLYSYAMNIFFCPILAKFCPLLEVWSSLGPDCPDHTSFCPLLSSGQYGSASRCHCTNTWSIFCTGPPSIGPQDHNPLLCHSAPVLHLKYATAVTMWSQCPCILSNFCIFPPFTLASRQKPCASYKISQIYQQ